MGWTDWTDNQDSLLPDVQADVIPKGLTALVATQAQSIG